MTPFAPRTHNLPHLAMQVTLTDNFERAGHVKASAVAGVAFLCVHPLGALGDACMTGPYRTALLDHGAFGVLLRAALSGIGDEECDTIVQQACSIGLMYMSTMAGSVDASELAMYSALLMDRCAPQDFSGMGKGHREVGVGAC
eukprot:77488-Chlamydomonas_euryale.AAC.3